MFDIRFHKFGLSVRWCFRIILVLLLMVNAFCFRLAEMASSRFHELHHNFGQGNHKPRQSLSPTPDSSHIYKWSHPSPSPPTDAIRQIAEGDLYLTVCTCTCTEYGVFGFHV